MPTTSLHEFAWLEFRLDTQCPTSGGESQIVEQTAFDLLVQENDFLTIFRARELGLPPEMVAAARDRLLARLHCGTIQ